MFTHRYRYLLMLGLGIYSYLNSLFSEVYRYYGIRSPWYDAFFAIILLTILVWEGNRLLEAVLKKRLKTATPTRFLLVFFFSGSIVSILLGAAIWYVATTLLRLPVENSQITLRLILTYSTRMNLFLHILNAIFVLVKEYKNKQVEAEEFKRISSQAELQSIKNQLNPHFLFNNLNVLSGLVIRDNPEANKFIEAFSSVYRYILNSQQKELVELKTELEVIQPYVFLLEKRFPGSLLIKWEIPDHYMLHKIVPASLQMLIENAIKHNIASKASPLIITFLANGDEMLTVSNNIQPKASDGPSTQWGLKNISRRYELVTGENITVSKGAFSFSVSLPLISPTL
ncbi:MAG: histidine kinase [Chitinophagaceae bacterium]|nr:histidine kinase [Chitinophagaceae bacterium]